MTCMVLITCRIKGGNTFRLAIPFDETLMLSASTGNFIAKVKWKVGGRGVLAAARRVWRGRGAYSRLAPHYTCHLITCFHVE